MTSSFNEMVTVMVKCNFVGQLRDETHPSLDLPILQETITIENFEGFCIYKLQDVPKIQDDHVHDWKATLHEAFQVFKISN